jgi:hypothetical protein
VLADAESLEEVETVLVERTVFNDGLWEWREKAISEGIARGRQEGARTLVRYRIACKFGSEAAAEVGPHIDQLSDPDRIAEVAAAVIECDTLEELIARVGET